MLYARQPTDQEQKELKRMARREVGRVSQRAQMVLLSIRRRKVPEIADIFGVCKPTVRFWIHSFNEHGPDGLYDQPRSGRPRKMTDEVKAKIIQLVQDEPNSAGYLATVWTVAMLALALVRTAGVTVSLGAVRKVLHQVGLRWGRPRLAMPNKVDPEKAQKQWAIVKAVIEAPPEAVILYADESRIHLLPLLRAMWHWAGQQMRIPTPGTNKTRALFGALDIRTGQWAYLVRERMRKEDFIAFLEHLLIVFPVAPLILIVDNYSSHTAHLVRDWLVAHPRLQLYYLPKYCSHLNPVEPIWLRLKGQIAANRLYGSIQLLVRAVEQFFNEMTPATALTWASTKC
jgi:transposase